LHANIKKISDMNKSSRNEFKEQYGTWALVAGAAEGIGGSFTEELAKKGMNLVMVDFNTSVLHDLAERIKKTYPVEIREITQDLSEKDAWVNCMTAIHDLDCRLLIYIPAYSRVKKFLCHSHDELDKYMDLNARTPIHLAHSFLSSVKEGKTAGILLMSSLAGLIGPPYLAPYAATKAFNILLAESLRAEYIEKNIDISVCCAGQTSTPAYLSSNPAAGNQWPPVMRPDKVAEYALKNLGKKGILIPGWQNRFSFFLLTKFITRSFAAKIVGNALRKLYPDI
jgi:uncharacterized protein